MKAPPPGRVSRPSTTGRTSSPRREAYLGGLPPPQAAGNGVRGPPSPACVCVGRSPGRHAPCLLRRQGAPVGPPVLGRARERRRGGRAGARRRCDPISTGRRSWSGASEGGPALPRIRDGGTLATRELFPGTMSVEGEDDAMLERRGARGEGEALGERSAEVGYMYAFTRAYTLSLFSQLLSPSLRVRIFRPLSLSSVFLSLSCSLSSS